MNEHALRSQLARVLAWKDAHASFDKAVAGVPPSLQGVQPQGLPYSLWQLLEHARITQFDILDFCRNSSYRELEWPGDYWPSSVAPPHEGAWHASIEGLKRDRQELQDLAADPAIDLFSTIPHGSGQTYLRELLLVTDHTAYHVGQMVLVRRLLGAWPKD
jgi:uncharacterized damage-inducible protein DinB